MDPNLTAQESLSPAQSPKAGAPETRAAETVQPACLLADQNSGKQAGEKRVLCIWLPNWSIQRVQALEPRLASAPLLLSIRDARRGLIIAAANLAARAQGIQPGMRLSEATAVVDATVREHDPSEDLETLCQLVEQAQQFSPLVGLETLDKKRWAGRTQLHPEVILLDVSGIANLFGGELALLKSVAKWLSQQHYFGCLGLAGNVATAWAFANYATREARAGRPMYSLLPLPPELAPPSTADSDSQSAATSAPPPPPCRYYIASPETATDVLNRYPLAALRLEQATLDALQRLGIRNIGQLGQLPRDGMASRLGQPLLTRLDQLFGKIEESIITLHGQPDWSLEQTLEFPTQHHETIVEVVRQLNLELAKRLVKRGEGALRIVCRLDFVDTTPQLLQLGLFRPTNEAEHLQRLLVGQLEQHFRNQVAAPLGRVCLQATLTAPMKWRQSELFAVAEADNRQQMGRLIDTLSSRLGRAQVLRARVKRDVQPELAYTLEPLTGRRPDGTEQDALRKLSSRISRQRAEPSREDPLRRPTHLLSPAVPIEVRQHVPADINSIGHRGVAQSAPSVSEHRAPSSTAAAGTTPAWQFKYQGSWHTVVHSIGPERLESGWWRGPSARREYFRLTTTRGSWWWVYRDLKTNYWYLHGLFD
ncbi:Y-family DNA polymerase [Aureliella helgolandensis]|uniref:DNA polymerase IV n=1 Tax=Aureliella helgolandensis TaxID=2527968 RepID=A0A518G5P4_9BACT|nr:DNA polymerase Y family protein [Aureliella helgolandensis]QDV23889.1 DNA polymerase IV [Aureliella helgolandensis]